MCSTSWWSRGGSHDCDGLYIVDIQVWSDDFAQAGRVVILRVERWRDPCEGLSGDNALVLAQLWAALKLAQEFSWAS